MSEFTDGFLILNTHRKLAQEKTRTLKHEHLFKDLNDQWLALLVDYRSLVDLPLLEWLNQSSYDFPLLHFSHPADHGWGYRLYTGGGATAAVDCQYDIAFNMAVDEAEKQHPNNDVIGELFSDQSVYEQFRNQVIQSDDYQDIVAEQYLYARPEEFTVFGFSESTILNLKQILTVAWYNDSAKRLKQVQRFKEEINIREMEWMSYRYASKP